jgi:MazG family protein
MRKMDNSKAGKHDASKPASPAAAAVERLRRIMERLRDPEHGCPWDVEQTFVTIAPYTIEEAYEVADAVQRGDLECLKDELGDLLLQVVFHAQMAREAGRFDLADVANAISDKMVRRHPHVFGETRIDTAEAQTKAWEEHKASERAAAAQDRGAAPSALDGVTVSLPALTRAEKLQRRAARVGFDWPEARPVLDKIAEELTEISDEMAAGTKPDRLRDEVGDLLFAVVNLARHLKIDPETALRAANHKFERRFREVEARLAKAGKAPSEASLADLEAQWQAVKAQE